MTPIILHGGNVPLSAWRAVLHGAEARPDPDDRAGVEAAAHTVATILSRGAPVYGINTGFGKLAGVRIGPEDLARLQRNIVLSHAAGVGAPLPAPVVRLIMALKLASLAQGASGVRWSTIALLGDCLDRGLIPLIPGQGSVGASGDLAPLAHLAAALIGEGSFLVDGQPVPAAEALQKAGLSPAVLGPKEGLALLNGTQVSTALALTGLFAAETAFQAALVTGALSTDAGMGSDTPFEDRIQRLRRHPGQIAVAAGLRALLAGSAIRDSHRTGDDRVQDPYCLRCQPQVMGAVLDLLRQAATTLETEANGVSDNPLVFADADGLGGGDVVSGGNFHAEPVAFAADMIAMALCEVGSLAERRIAMLVDPAVSAGLPAFLTPRPGLNSGFMIPQVTAAALVSENKQRAYPASVDSIPTSANQEDHVSMACHGARRLLPMAANLEAVIGIELLAAAQGCDFRRPLASSAPLEQVRRSLRTTVPMLEDDRFFAPDIDAATAMVRGGDLHAWSGVALPGVA